MAFLFKTSKLRPYKACKSLADTPISQKLANILTGLAYLQGAPICTTEIHSAESGWLVGTTCVYLSFTLLYTSKINLNMIPKLVASFCCLSSLLTLIAGWHTAHEHIHLYICTICTSSKYVHKKEQMKISPAYSLTWYSTINCFDGAFVTSLSFLMDEHIPSVKTRKKVIGHSTNIPVLNESVCVCWPYPPHH